MCQIHPSTLHTYYLMEFSEISYLVISSPFTKKQTEAQSGCDFAKLLEFVSGKAREPQVNPKFVVLQSTLPTLQLMQ